MTKQEFQKRIGAEISQKDYSIVEHVYTWHPSISEVEGKGLLPGRRATQSCNQPEDNEELRHICNIRRKRKRDLGVLRKLFSSHVCRC